MSAEVEKYAPVLRCSPIGCIIVSGGVIRAANPEVVETTGIPLGRLLGVPLCDLLVPEFQAPLAALLDDASEATSVALGVRLSRALAPVELLVRRLDDGVNIVGVRSMATEYFFSAKAAGSLTHDVITGFPDRYQLLSQLHDRITATQPTPLALVCLWIDELPQLVSTNGERAVDRVVREVGQRIQGRLRSPDVLGRFDEAGFLTLLTSDAPTTQLTEIAERLRAEVAFPVEFDGSLVSFTASVAVASVSDRRPSVERALAQLEAAGNRAKAGGGNRTEILEL